jgi:hypothetical protein
VLLLYMHTKDSYKNICMLKSRLTSIEVLFGRRVLQQVILITK